MKDFLCSAHLHESFGGRIYTYGSVLKSKFVQQRIHEDGHYRENPSNHELLTVRGGDCRASKKMFRGLLPPYSLTSTASPSVPVFAVTPNLFNFIMFVSISGEDFSTRWAVLILFSLVMIINYNSFRLWCVSSASALFNQCRTPPP